MVFLVCDWLKLAVQEVPMLNCFVSHSTIPNIVTKSVSEIIIATIIPHCLRKIVITNSYKHKQSKSNQYRGTKHIDKPVITLKTELLDNLKETKQKRDL